MSIIFFFFFSILSNETITTIDLDSEEVEIGEQVSLNGNGPLTSDSLTVDISWPWLTKEKSDAVNQQLRQQFEKALALAQENPDQVRDMVIEAAPPIVFCLVPLFALLLKLMYLTQHRFYTEHLVLALHNHSFLFLAFLTELLLDKIAPVAAREWLESPIDFWILVYLFLSLKNNYGEGWAITSVKFVLLGLTYWIFFAVIVLAAGIIGILNL